MAPKGFAPRALLEQRTLVYNDFFHSPPADQRSVFPDGIGCGHGSATLRCAVLKLVSMRQFVLVDQSIRGLTGHHYEYAVHVLGAAAKAGYEPLLAANRKFATQAEKNWRVFPEYEFGFWSEPRKQQLAGPLVERVRRIWFLARCRLRFSFLGLAWLGRNDWAKYLSRRAGGFSGFVTHVLGVLFIVAMKVLRLAGLLILLPFWALALAFLAFWELLKLLVRPPRFQRYVRAFVQELKTYAEFTKAVLPSAGRNGADGEKRSRASRRVAAAFGRDSRNLFSKVELRRGMRPWARVRCGSLPWRRQA